MTLSLVAVGAKITAAILNKIINAVNAGGAALVPPASVAGTGVSLTTLGKVTFTAATSVSLDGVFTGAYDNYEIVFDIPTLTAAALVSFRFRAAGTDDNSGNYSREVVTSSGTTTTTGPTLSDTLTYVTAAAVLNASGKVSVFNAARPLAKRLLAFSYGVNGSTQVVGQVGTVMNTTTAYDGFTITAASGTMTGTVRVYGFNNG